MSKFNFNRYIFLFFILLTCFDFAKPEIDNLWFTSSFFQFRFGLGKKIKSCSFFDQNDPSRVQTLEKLKEACPPEIYPIFDPTNEKWKSFFGKNCKSLIKHPSLGGEFGFLNPEKTDQKNLEYGFFKGDRYPNTLIVIAGGAFYDKHFVLPYIILINKVLGYSCAILDYRGHENSWDDRSVNHFLFKSRDKKRDIDTRRFRSGLGEGRDFFDMVRLIRRKNPSINNCIGLGICFGGAVLSVAQNINMQRYRKPLFQSMALISPLPGISDLIINFLSYPKKRTLFFGKDSMLLKIGGFLASQPIFHQIVAWQACKRTGLENISYIPFYSRIRVPTFVIASHDSDEIVTRSMVLRVWRALSAKHRLILWSSGVGHLFNWRSETAQLIVSLGNFFKEPIKAIEDPFYELVKTPF